MPGEILGSLLTVFPIHSLNCGWVKLSLIAPTFLVVRRIDVDAFDATGMRRQQCLRREQVVAFNYLDCHRDSASRLSKVARASDRIQVCDEESYDDTTQSQVSP